MLSTCLLELDKWGTKKFGHIPKKIRISQKRLEELYKVSHVPGKIQEIREEESLLDELMAQEEQWWSQRSRAQWLKEGDRNTHFFSSQGFTEEEN
ncbi:ribonuclease H [Sesbania bispinosa]|nr:ribonuclease H [Sesbania bispinosa]